MPRRPGEAWGQAAPDREVLKVAAGRLYYGGRASRPPTGDFPSPAGLQAFLAFHRFSAFPESRLAPHRPEFAGETSALPPASLDIDEWLRWEGGRPARQRATFRRQASHPFRSCGDAFIWRSQANRRSVSYNITLDVEEYVSTQSGGLLWKPNAAFSRAVHGVGYKA